MSPQVEAVFTREIYRQCGYAWRGYKEMKSWLDALQSGEPTTSLDDFWFWAQSLLVASANISKLLWGSSADAAARREALRAKLGVEDESPLRLRTLRNHFEHLDERIEASAEAGNFVGDSVMPSGAFHHAETMPDAAKAQLRNFDPETGMLSFWDDKIHLDTLGSEIARVGQAAGPVFMERPVT